MKITQKDKFSDQYFISKDFLIYQVSYKKQSIPIIYENGKTLAKKAIDLKVVNV